MTPTEMGAMIAVGVMFLVCLVQEIIDRTRDGGAR